MPLFCISDLHLGDKGPRDNFAARGADRFLRFLDYVERQNGQLLVLGDLFDWWEANLSRSVCAYLDLFERLAYHGPLGATWVAGNHDSAMTEFIGHGIVPFGRLPMPALSRPFEATIGGKKFAFLHGHEADPYCRNPNPGVGEITAIISGMLEDRNRGPNYRGHAVEDEFVGTLESALTLWRKVTLQHGRLDGMIDGVEAYRHEKNADVVVSGHTHAAGHIDEHHWNTGCWCRDTDTFVRIGDDGSVSLWEWDGTAAVLFSRTLR